MLDYDHVKFWFSHGIWSAALVNMAATKGIITKSQAQDIIKAGKAK